MSDLDESENENAVDIGEVLDSDQEDFDDTRAANAIVSVRKKQKKRSPLWQHFDEIEVDGKRYAEFKICVQKQITTRYLLSGKSNSGTGNMTKHLEKKHAGEVLLQDFRRDDDGVFVFSQEAFRKALIKWIVLADQPFTEPQQQSFVDLVHSLNPHAKLISDKTVRADIMETYVEKLADVKALIQKIPGKLSISLDGWTSKNVLPFLAIRGHWFDLDWNYHSILFDFSYIHGKHSGWKHSCIFRDCLSNLGISTSKILGVTGDNASSNDTFFQWMEDHGLSELANQMRCLCHIFNLAVKDLLALLNIPVPEDDDVDAENHDFENEVLEDIDLNEIIIFDDEESETVPLDDTNIITKLRSMVKKIRKSVKLRQKLKKCCDIYGIPYRIVIIDVQTRWNSTYHMIVRAKDLKVALKVLCTHESSLTSLQLNEEEWKYLDVVENLLGKFDRATKLMSMERHCTIYSYIPTMDWIIDSVRNFITDHTGPLRRAAEGALAKLLKYEVRIDTCIIPFIATTLHPALKLQYFKEHEYSTSEIREIKKAISEYFTTNYETDSNDEDYQSSSDDQFRMHMFKRSRVERTSSEMTKYLSLPLANRKVDPVAYWKSQTQEFPRLSSMARDIFSVQSASTCVERDFSKGTRFVTPTRCAMQQTTIRASMSLKSWYSMN